MDKPNLIITHSYPTNSVILRGLIEYLKNFYNVYFIDLPGFIKTSTPLEQINFKNYADYIDTKINEFNLDSYFIAGISFGFLIINNAKLNKNCKGIIAIEPYTNTQELSINIFSKMTFEVLLELIYRLHISNVAWNSKLVRATLLNTVFARQPRQDMLKTFENIEGRTFVETGRLILENRENCIFHKNLPYALLINDNDNSINAKYLIKLFKRNLKTLKIIHTKIEHFPTEEMNQQYFARELPPKIIQDMNDFLEGSH